MALYYVNLVDPNGTVWEVPYRRGVQRKRTGLGNASGVAASAAVRGMVEAAVESLGLFVGYGIDGGTVARCAAGCRCPDTDLPIVGGVGRATLVDTKWHALGSLAALEGDRVALDLPGWEAPDGLPYAPATVAPVCGDCNGNVAHRAARSEQLEVVAYRLLRAHASIAS